MTYSSVYLVVDAPQESKLNGDGLKAAASDINGDDDTNIGVIAALKQAIQSSADGRGLCIHSLRHASQDERHGVAVPINVVSTQGLPPELSAAALVSELRDDLAGDKPSPLICPLTLHLPETLPFASRTIFDRCCDTAAMRQYVQQHWGYASGNGTRWLPIVWTAKGPLYAEVIGHEGNIGDETGSDPTSLYQQPLHLSDEWRQPLYRLGFNLLTSLAAPPAVYLLQFDLEEDALVFDRLWPFPHRPALASVGVQTPNLFECHWRCLTHQPIWDVAIVPELQPNG